jgi:hypothetical protein
MKNIFLILFSILTFGLNAQTIVKVEKISDKTYKVVTDYNLDTNKDYNFLLVEKPSIVYKEGVIIPIPKPVDTTKPSCKNGDFSIISIGFDKSSIDFQFNASNLSKGIYEISKDNQVLKSGYFQPTSNIISVSTGDLKAGNYSLIITGESCNGIAQKGFTISGNSPPISGGLETNNTSNRAIQPQKTIIPESKLWNWFYTDFPSIDIPKKLNKATGKIEAVFDFVWHAPGINIFAYEKNKNEPDAKKRAENIVSEMGRLGISSVAWNYLRENLGEKAVSKSGVNQKTGIVIGGQLHTVENETTESYTNRAVSDMVSSAIAFSMPMVNGKYSGYKWVQDGENEYTAGNRQRDADAKVNAHYTIAETFDGEVTDLYNAPNNNLGYMDERYFNGETKMYSWYGKAQQGKYAGKSQDDNPIITSLAEMATYREDIEDQYAWVKDQNGNNWFKINHFGENVGTEISYRNPKGCNARHYLTQYAGIVWQNSKDARRTGHKNYVSYKRNNQIGSGYMYDQSSAIWNDNKYFFELGKWGSEYQDHPDVSISAGDTPMKPHQQEGAVVACMFSGADGVYYWDSAWNPYYFPIQKDGNERTREHQIDETRDRVPRESIGYMLNGFNMLGLKHRFNDGKMISFFDLMSLDGAKYLYEELEYSIDGGVNFVKTNPLTWQKKALPVVVGVVNDSEKKMFIYVQEAYNECREKSISKVKIKYKNNIEDVEILNDNQVNIIGFTIK